MMRTYALIGLMIFSGCSMTLLSGSSTPQQTVDVWKEDMLEFAEVQGRNLKNGGQDVYYDGTRVFYQIADYTREKEPWSTYAKLANKVYRDTSGSIDWTGRHGWVAGWNNFSTGLRMHYERTGDQRSKDAVHLLATHGWAADGGPTFGYLYSREIAYAILNHLDDEALGAPHRARLDELITTALKHFDEMFISKIALTKPYRGEDGHLAGITPFMVGLEAQALIAYYEKYHDARIPPMIKAAAEVLYETVTPLGVRIWDPQKGGFLYDTIWGGGKVYEPGLNLLIVPLYAWVYHTTGDATYRDRGEEIMRQGVHRSHCGSVGGFCQPGEQNGSYLWFGKQFNQQYMWSARYVEWRQSANDQPPIEKPRN